MQRVTSFPGRSVFLVGSVHSTVNCLPFLSQISPKIVFLETTHAVMALLRRNERHSPRLVDLPALLKFADSSSIDVRPVDISLEELCSRVFHDLPVRHKLALWKYVTLRFFHSPIARLVFLRVLRDDSLPFLDDYVKRWLLSNDLLLRCRECLIKGGSDQDVEKIIESTQSTSSFLASTETDSGAYMEICDLTGIDKRLQRFIIEFRNDYMCDRIRRTLNTLPDGTVCAAVVGKNHVDGMFTNLSKGPGYVFEPSLPVGYRKSSFLDQVLLASLLR